MKKIKRYSIVEITAGPEPISFNYRLINESTGKLKRKLLNVTLMQGDIFTVQLSKSAMKRITKK